MTNNFIPFTHLVAKFCLCLTYISWGYVVYPLLCIMHFVYLCVCNCTWDNLIHTVMQVCHKYYSWLITGLSHLNDRPNHNLLTGYSQILVVVTIICYAWLYICIIVLCGVRGCVKLLWVFTSCLLFCAICFSIWLKGWSRNTFYYHLIGAALYQQYNVLCIGDSKGQRPQAIC